MTTEAPNPPQSFDDLELRLAAEHEPAPDILPPPTTDAAQDDARNGAKPTADPKVEKTTTPTQPKATEPKAKEEPAPKDQKAKAAERQDRSWQKLTEEREKDRLAREDLAREKAAIAKEREEIARAKAEAPKQQPPTDAKPKDPELTVESLTNLATAKRDQATRLRNSGKFAEAEQAEKVAEEAEAYAKSLPATGPSTPAKPAPSTQPTPGTPEFHAAQQQVAQQLAEHHPDLNNPESPLTKATQLALRAMPHLQRTPDGVAGAVAVAEVILDRNAARQSEAALKQQVESLTTQLKEAQSRIAGAPPGGGATNPPTTTDLSKLPRAQAWDTLQAQI